MQQLKPWFRILVLVDTVLFFVGGGAILVYGSADGNFWPFVGFLGATAVLGVVIGILYWWQTRR